MWLGKYLPQEVGVHIQRDSTVRNWFGKNYFLHHGDGLGPGDAGYKFIKRLFRNKFLQACFGWLHPNLGVGLAYYLSRRSRKSHQHIDDVDHGEKEFLVQYVKSVVNQPKAHHYYVFGHRHMARRQGFSGAESQLLVLGDWFKDFSYLEITPEGPIFQTFRNGYAEPDLTVINKDLNLDE
jgi:UDP-2,3-diacylglucosamine hydrolase